MTTKTMGKAQSLTLVGIAYVVAIAVGAVWLLRGVQFLGLAGVVRCGRRAVGRLVGVPGALGMLGMFLGGSIPIMETRSLERRPDYQDVVDRVSRFVTRPPRRA